MQKPDKNVAPLKGRAARRARKAARAGRPKRLAQIREAFVITRRRDKRLLPYLALAFVATLAFFELAGIVLGSPIVFSVFGVVSAVLVTFIVFGQRAQRSALGEIEGQPGAAAAIIDSMRGDWRLTPNVAATRSEEHTSELQSLRHLVCRLLLEKKKT